MLKSFEQEVTIMLVFRRMARTFLHEMNSAFHRVRKISAEVRSYWLTPVPSNGFFQLSQRFWLILRNKNFQLSPQILNRIEIRWVSRPFDNMHILISKPRSDLFRFVTRRWIVQKIFTSQDIHVGLQLQ